MRWKEIENTNGFYLISDTGKVFSARTGRILKTGFRDGYEHVELNIGGKPKKHYVHRLVAQAFVPNPNGYDVVNHKDENPANNHADNLEWCTQRYNVNYGNCIAKRKANRKPKASGDYPSSRKVYQFDLDGNFIAEYGSAAEAGRAVGCDSNCIFKVVNGVMKKYAGYYWNTEKIFDYNPEHKRVFKKGAILKLDDAGNVIERYTDVRKLEADGYRQISVNRVCRGERNTYKGFHWRHEGEEE